MRGIVFTNGTERENYQAAFDIDASVFAAYFGPTPPAGTTRIADPVGPKYLDGKTWLYPVYEEFEALTASLNLGTIVDVDDADWFEPVGY